jgi:RES domain-containing protein
MGAKLEGGRWNSPGRAVVYACLCYGTTLLERLVHLNHNKFPRSLRYVEITIPDTVSRLVIDPRVVNGWDRPDMLASRLVGDQWLDGGRSALLIVPSVPAPLDRNVVINTAHPDAGRLVVSDELPIVTDPRLVR